MPDRIKPAVTACIQCGRGTRSASAITCNACGGLLRPAFPGEVVEVSTRRPVRGRKRDRIFRRDGYRCVECGANGKGVLTIDHIIPVVRGGTNDDDNLQTLCEPCNREKGCKLPV